MCGRSGIYDFNVWTERKRVEKLRYMHRNPVKRGLVESPEQWAWSSLRAYAYGEKGSVRVNYQEWELKIKIVGDRNRGGQTERSPYFLTMGKPGNVPSVPGFPSPGFPVTLLERQSRF